MSEREHACYWCHEPIRWSVKVGDGQRVNGDWVSDASGSACPARNGEGHQEEAGLVAADGMITGIPREPGIAHIHEPFAGERQDNGHRSFRCRCGWVVHKPTSDGPWVLAPGRNMTDDELVPPDVSLRDRVMFATDAELLSMLADALQADGRAYLYRRDVAEEVAAAVAAHLAAPPEWQPRPCGYCNEEVEAMDVSGEGPVYRLGPCGHEFTRPQLLARGWREQDIRPTRPDWLLGHADDGTEVRHSEPPPLGSPPPGLLSGAELDRIFAQEHQPEVHCRHCGRLIRFDATAGAGGTWRSPGGSDLCQANTRSRAHAPLELVRVYPDGRVELPGDEEPRDVDIGGPDPVAEELRERHPGLFCAGPEDGEPAPVTVVRWRHPDEEEMRHDIRDQASGRTLVSMHGDDAARLISRLAESLAAELSIPDVEVEP